MIEIVDNKWRPFIKLHIADVEDGGGNPVGDHSYYFDITSRVSLCGIDGGTEICYLSCGQSCWVSETPEEIIEACDRLITEEQDKKAAEAHKYFEETQARVAATAAALKKGDK